MAKERILVIDDDEEIQMIARQALEPEGYAVQSALSGEDGLQLVAKSTPDIVLLDLMLPEMDGLEVCRQLKANPQYQGIPVIMLSAKNGEADIVAGLELGAEDYVTKPFSPRVLLARLRTALRRRAAPARNPDTAIEIHDLVIHPGRHEVLHKQKVIALTPTEFNILRILATRPGWVFTRYQIVDAIRGEDFAVTDRSVDVQISALRRKMGKAGQYIETVRGIGYRFKD